MAWIKWDNWAGTTIYEEVDETGHKLLRYKLEGGIPTNLLQAQKQAETIRENRASDLGLPPDDPEQETGEPKV